MQNQYSHYTSYLINNKNLMEHWFLNPEYRAPGIAEPIFAETVRIDLNRNVADQLDAAFHTRPQDHSGAFGGLVVMILAYSDQEDFLKSITKLVKRIDAVSGVKYPVAFADPEDRDKIVEEAKALLGLRGRATLPGIVVFPWPLIEVENDENYFPRSRYFPCARLSDVELDATIQNVMDSVDRALSRTRLPLTVPGNCGSFTPNCAFDLFLLNIGDEVTSYPVPVRKFISFGPAAVKNLATASEMVSNIIKVLSVGKKVVALL